MTSPTEIRVRGYCRSLGTDILLPPLEIQQRHITDSCNYKRYRLVDLYIDRETSGKNIVRPAFQKMISEATSGDVLMFCTLSIFSESIQDTLALISDMKNRNINIICIQPEIDSLSPVGGLILSAFLALYSIEKKMLPATETKRVGEAQTRTRAPFGFRFISKEKPLEEVPEQKRVIEKIIKLYKELDNYSKVAEKLNEDKDNYVIYVNRKNPPARIPQFRAEMVKRILSDHGVIKAIAGRMPLKQRLLSKRQPESSSSSTSVAATSSTATSSASMALPVVPQIPINLASTTISFPTSLPITVPLTVPLTGASDDECSGDSI